MLVQLQFGKMAMTSPQNDHIRPIDQTVLELLRLHSAGMTIQELTERLEVTPTAVRQRLERLDQLELVERRKEQVGRGRPLYRYGLTQLGSRFASANYADLATALWQELMQLPNVQQRGRVLHRVAQRMGRGLKDAIPAGGTVNERLSATATALGRRKVAAVMNESGRLPILEVHACPYPDLAVDQDGRQLCELEQEMLSEAVGLTMQLDCCRLDGHNHCQFRPVGELSTGVPSVQSE